MPANKRTTSKKTGPRAPKVEGEIVTIGDRGARVVKTRAGLKAKDPLKGSSTFQSMKDAVEWLLS